MPCPLCSPESLFVTRSGLPDPDKVMARVLMAVTCAWAGHRVRVRDAAPHRE